MNSSTARTIVRITCLDKVGLVALFSRAIADVGANIRDATQHQENGTFFQRFEIDIADERREALSERLRYACSEVDGNFDISYPNQPQRIAIFVSKTKHCLYELLLEYEDNNLPGEVAVIISNHPDLERVAKHFDVPFFHIPVDSRNRRNSEQQQLELLREFDINLVVLARYMQVLSQEFVNEYALRIINVHHASLPAFQGKDPYERAYKRGVKTIGATAHYVTEELDEGPYICQVTSECTHRDTAKDMRKVGRHNEREALTRAVRDHLNGRLFVNSLRVVRL